MVLLTCGGIFTGGGGVRLFFGRMGGKGAGCKRGRMGFAFSSAHTMQPAPLPPNASAVAGRRSDGARKRGRMGCAFFIRPHNASPIRPFAPLPRLPHASCICRSQTGLRPFRLSASAASRIRPKQPHAAAPLRRWCY